MVLAQPWWVNTLIVVPVVVFWFFGKQKLALTTRQLSAAAIFGIAFGFVEAAVVIYLRAALGFLPGYMGTLADIVRQSENTYQQIEAARSLPQSFLTVEVFREIATMVVLGSVALLSAAKRRERFALFLWMFAWWDIFYYVGLWLTVRWPSALTTDDMLFLIPAPWIAQVWFPLLVSMLTLLAVALNNQDQKQET